MIFRQPPRPRDPLRAHIDALYHADGSAVMEAVLDEADLGPLRPRVRVLARRLVQDVRGAQDRAGTLDSFLQQYRLSTEEGVVLMCLAEALLRIPDTETQDKLIQDKLHGADWERHLGQSRSLFVNASTWGLMLTGKLVRLNDAAADAGFVERLAARIGGPVIRDAMLQAVRILSDQFVMGRGIAEAIARAGEAEAAGARHSYDMLGEAALTEPDARRYAAAYADAIATLGRASLDRPRRVNVLDRPGISIKLSALHPRFEWAQRDDVMARLVPRLADLIAAAGRYDLGVTIDAEEASRLDLTLDVFEAVYRDPTAGGWDGLGLAVQAYQKRARAVVDWLAAMAHRGRRRIPVRLVKGAYWDTEIKRAQEGGFDGYPVFTRKVMTDVSYLACARGMLAHREAFYPQFATHNAHTLAAVTVLAEGRLDVECQRLHGMGEALYAALLRIDARALPCRVYAPVGSHEDLLPYLVRRLLENGANSSFVNRLADASAPIDRLIADPVEAMRTTLGLRQAGIPLPRDLYGATRVNARGLDLSSVRALTGLAKEMQRAGNERWSASPVVSGKRRGGLAVEVRNPADRRDVVGDVREADVGDVGFAVAAAVAAQPAWDGLGAAARAQILERAADLYEVERARLMMLAVREAGKTLGDAQSEVREAVDFLRYYAQRIKIDGAPQALPGPTGEANTLKLHGRGAFVCISPWNFPLAIFTGQVAAALAAGNAALAKPAEQTPLIAALAVDLLHKAGVPAEVLHLLPGAGETVGAALVADPRVAGVAMTGSTATAAAIARTLAQRQGPIVPLIAETGGQNALIADSSALPEQLVADAVRSAFNSAGQRCSACRVLFVQEDIAARVTTMLAGAMAELRVGDPAYLDTDVGPVIDAEALAALNAHAERMDREARLLATAPIAGGLDHGTFFAPRAYAIPDLGLLEREVFGPILHVVTFAAERLDEVVDRINATGYGLTLGIHSRVGATAQRIIARARVGNIYVNRNMIGAVVGVQPFGGEGLSGTGPKAGGPHYLPRFALERTVSDNIAAIGGNASLLSLVEEATE
jgi:RHH-type proline utilization regulon transcriptional repressor/proline dehydrogenase/delta 1-pyrroline-5-carboxylate dehydrogenase